MYLPAAPVSRYGMRGSLEGFETERCSNEALDDVVEDILLGKCTLAAGVAPKYALVSDLYSDSTFRRDHRIGKLQSNAQE